MRGAFFAYLGVGLLCLILFYCVWLVLHAFWTVLADMWTNRELDKLAEEYVRKRDERKVELSQRMNNGCEHLYDDLMGALPEGVCTKCGLAKERPFGPCDHVWRVISGAIPESQCEKCGEKFATVAESPDPA